MKLGEYKTLNKASTKNVFNDYINSFEIPIIDYIAIGVQDTILNKSTSIMSRDEWQKTFRDQGLAKHDPLRKASLTRKSTLFSFDELDCQDDYGKEIMRQRRLHEIENGIVVMRKNIGHNFILTLGTGYKNFSPYKFFVDKHEGINRVFDDLISLVMPVTKDYRLDVFNRQHVDAI